METKNITDEMQKAFNAIHLDSSHCSKCQNRKEVTNIFGRGHHCTAFANECPVIKKNFNHA